MYICIFYNSYENTQNSHPTLCLSRSFSVSHPLANSQSPFDTFFVLADFSHNIFRNRTAYQASYIVSSWIFIVQLNFWARERDYKISYKQILCKWVLFSFERLESSLLLFKLKQEKAALTRRRSDLPNYLLSLMAISPHIY